MTAENKTNRFRNLAVLLAAACLAAGAGYYAGSAQGLSEATEQQKLLQELNRSSIEKINIMDDGVIHVIGHRSPDSDTVISAIAYARLLTMLGYPAEPAITQPISAETQFILDQAGAPVPEELLDASGENIFLVDHSEYAQAAEGMQDAHIVGILDHHGIGTVSTGHQVIYEAKPIGATATIVWLDYLNYGVELDRTTAILLLGGILSDTYNLVTTTTTEADRRAVSILAEETGITDTDGFYRQLHEKSMSYEGMTNEEILFSDYKEYEASGTKFGIGLTSAIDEDAARELAEKLKDALPDGFASHDVDLMYGAITLRENGLKMDYIIPADEQSEAILKDAFPNYDEFDGTSYIYRSGMGRKSVFVPGLTDYLGAHPHE